MFRKENGRSGFSFGRFVTNMIPNFANDSKNDVDLLAHQKDLLFTYQLRLPNPRALGQEAFLHGGITDNKSTSKSVHNALLKNGCLNKDTGIVDTTKVTKHFANQLAVISVHAQRKLVSLLFYWEEELTRWSMMDREQVEIDTQIANLGEDIAARENLDLALKAVQANRMLLPSRRPENGALQDNLPTYSQSVESQ